jgi:hypothetical protein
MRNMTTAVHVTCPYLPTSGLRQSMLDFSPSLELEAFFRAPGLQRDEVSQDITRFLIADTIRQLHPKSYEKVFNHHPSMSPKMPQLKILAPQKMPMHQLGAIFHDEGTIEGTYGVHRDIWINKFGLKEEDEAHCFDDRLWLVWGDQKTAQMIRSLKGEQIRARRAFDRRAWLIGPTALWHTQQSLLHLMVRTHWESLGTIDSKATLRHGIVYWDRRGITRENAKYHLVEPLITQGWKARVLAPFYETLSAHGRLQGVDVTKSDRVETFDKAIGGLLPSEFLNIVEQVREVAFTYDAWLGQHGDKEFTSMCRYLQQGELFLTLRHAVRHGDTGLIRRLLEPLCVMFYGAEQMRYGYEMMYLRWLLTDGVSSPELQESLLGSSLVNLTGRPDSFKAIDLALEHVNSSYAIDMKMYKNSTHDVEKTFDRVALTSSYISPLRTAIEKCFGEAYNPKHGFKSTLADIFSLACHLFAEGYGKPGPRINAGNLNTHDQFESHDVLGIGSELLPGKIDAFNADKLKLLHESHQSDEDSFFSTGEDLEELEGFFDMDSEFS